MERHKCKLCFKSFVNGRALGGHMRSHMMNLPIQPKPNQPIQIRDEDEVEAEAEAEAEVEAQLASYSSDDDDDDDDDDEEGEGEDKGLCYGLRENPKKSFRLVDPEFSFNIDAGSSVVVVQDRESETESSKNPTRRRSKRARRLSRSESHQCNQHHTHHHQQQEEEQEQETSRKINVKCNNNKFSKTESWVEPEPVSSISDTTTEEDVAFCLIMLSRDKWLREDQRHDRANENTIEEDSYESDEIKLCSKSTKRVRGKYKCETCNKTFRSYQALGGHRASHKKIRVILPNLKSEPENAGTTVTTTISMADRKIHECPVCYRVFSSGQALGGHKRSHVTGSAAAVPAKIFAKFGDSLIDLNLPAPIDDDDISQIELSAVSDGEFVNPIK